MTLQTCDTMTTDSRWTSVIDTAANWGNTNPLASVALGNGSFPLTVKHNNISYLCFQLPASSVCDEFIIRLLNLPGWELCFGLPW